MSSDNDNDSFVSFLLVLIRDWLVLGAVSSIFLDRVFNYWQDRTGKPIASYDKGLIATLAPVSIASAAYFLLCALGRLPLSLNQLTQVIYLGFRTAIGAQGVYNFYKKYIEEKVTQTIITNIGTIDSSRDVYLGSNITNDH
jgi:hypothetical protein